MLKLVRSTARMSKDGVTLRFLEYKGESVFVLKSWQMTPGCCLTAISKDHDPLEVITAHVASTEKVGYVTTRW